MTSLESMAATFQAVATLQGLQAIPGLGSIYSGGFDIYNKILLKTSYILFQFVIAGLFYPQLGQQLAHASSIGENHSLNSGNIGGSSSNAGGSGGGGGGASSQKSLLSSPSENAAPNAEMPLDLSAKSTTPTFPSNDSRNVFQSISR